MLSPLATTFSLAGGLELLLVQLALLVDVHLHHIGFILGSASLSSTTPFLATFSPAFFLALPATLFLALPAGFSHTLFTRFLAGSSAACTLAFGGILLLYLLVLLIELIVLIPPTSAP